MCRFPSPLTVAAVIGGYPHAPPEGPAMQRAGPAPGPVRPYAPWGMLAAIDAAASSTPGCCTAGRSTPTRRRRLPSCTSAAGRSCGCSSDDREAGGDQDEPPDPSETSPGVVRVDDHARGDGRLDVRARRRGDGGRRAARRVPAAERTRAPARARLPGRDVRAVGRRPAGEPRRQLGAPAVRPGPAPTRSPRPPSSSQGGGARTQRLAAAAGYVATEIAKEAPYYAGAFGGRGPDRSSCLAPTRR